MIVVYVLIAILTIIASAVAARVSTVLGLFYLSAELLYAIMTPQLITVLYVKPTNSYGSFVAFWISFLLRMLSGETYISLPAVMKYYGYNEETGAQMFPFRTLIAVISFLLVILNSSYL